MGRYLEEPGTAAATPREAWELVAKRRLQEAEKIRGHFSTSSFELREANWPERRVKNYRDYAFRRLGRFDYTPADCARFNDAVRPGSHACRSRNSSPPAAVTSASTNCIRATSVRGFGVEPRRIVRR